MKTPAFFRVLLASIAALLISVSCNPDGGNSLLVGTKWYVSDGTEHLEFEMYDLCFYYIGSTAVASGVYEYNASKSEITFDSFFLSGENSEGTTVTLQFTHAKLINSGAKMQLYCHELTETEEHYIPMTKI